MPKFKRKEKCVNLSFDFIEKYIPEANPTYIIVYIYALRLAMENIEAEYSEIAQRLHIVQSDVVKAFEYWQQCGLAVSDGENIIFNEFNENTEKISRNTGKFNENNNKISAENIGAQNKNAQGNKEDGNERKYIEGKYIENKQYDNIEMSNDIQLNELLADMLEKAQEFFGKPLNTNEIQTLYSMYEQLNLPPQVIVLLIEYCVSKKKTNMNYIEKIAVSWSEKGITTLESAIDFLEAEKNRNDLLSELKKIFRLYDRNFTEMEEEIIINWINSYNTDVELIKYAYEITVMNTNKFSVQYMDRIIERWYKEGISDINAAKASSEKFRQKQQDSYRGQYDTRQDDSYNYKDLENREWNNKK